ncbi:MAG: HAD-IA family hydrolase [Patescibacteria group bacterium]|nr:HAD-IA family hydrolase [Patescibacteria group bacterium]
MIKLLIFDWDDVITLGAKDGYFACYHKAINGVGVFLSPDEEKKRILAKWSKPYREELKELLKDNLDLVDKAVQMYEKEYWGDTFVDSLTAVTGINELLIKLKEKYILAVATGNHPKMLKERIIPHFNIPDVFAQIFSTFEIQDVNKMKPHPYMLEKIMKDQNCLPDETLFIGDAKTDVLTAQNAKVEPVVVLTGHLSKREAQDLKVKHIINDITGIETVLNTI